MSEWNGMTYEGKDTLLRVVREQADAMFSMIEDPETWEAPTACEGWTTRDVVGHIVDTTEGYFTAFEAARGEREDKPAHGLPVMAELANQGATSFRSDAPVERATISSVSVSYTHLTLPTICSV